MILTHLPALWLLTRPKLQTWSLWTHLNDAARNNTNALKHETIEIFPQEKWEVHHCLSRKMYSGIVHKHERSLSPDSCITFQWKNLESKIPFWEQTNNPQGTVWSPRCNIPMVLVEGIGTMDITILRKKTLLFAQFLRLEICIWGKSLKRQKERCINWKWTTQERKRNAITDRKRKPAIEHLSP